MSSDLFASKTLKRKASKCCVPSCKDPTSLDMSYHSFPLDKALAKQWLDILRIEEVNEGMKVCGAHFNSEDFFPTFGEFKTHKLKVKRLKRTAIPTLQLPIKDEPLSTTLLTDDEECEVVISELSSTVTQEHSETDKYLIGSYVCTACGYLGSTEASFLEHLNSHVKQESHSGGDVARIKVEPESHFLPEEDNGDSADDVDPFNGVKHPNDADGGTIEDDEESVPVFVDEESVPVSSVESECDEVDPLKPDAKSTDDLLEECMVGNTLAGIVGGKKKQTIFKRAMWNRRKRLIRFPPFTEQKLLHGDALFFVGEKPKYSCLRCPFRGLVPRLFSAHLQLHSGGKRFACISCQNYFDSEEALIDKHTSGSSSCGTIVVLDFLLRCDECWEFFKTQQELMHHMMYDSCTKRIKVTCKVCNREVIKRNMESHLKKH